MKDERNCVKSSQLKLMITTNLKKLIAPEIYPSKPNTRKVRKYNLPAIKTNRFSNSFIPYIRSRQIIS